MGASDQKGAERALLGFGDAVTTHFDFLDRLGFKQTEVLPTLVRYKKDDCLAVAIHHGRSSYEIGFEISYAGNRCSLGQLIRSTDPEAHEGYRPYTAITREGVLEGVALLAALVRRYGQRALDGDPKLFSELKEKREIWGRQYELEVLAAQSRPKAEAAFRRGDYGLAAELYEGIRPCLSPVELRKLSLARQRAGL